MLEIFSEHAFMQYMHKYLFIKLTFTTIHVQYMLKSHTIKLEIKENKLKVWNPKLFTLCKIPARTTLISYNSFPFSVPQNNPLTPASCHCPRGHTSWPHLYLCARCSLCFAVCLSKLPMFKIQVNYEQWTVSTQAAERCWAPPGHKQSTLYYLLKSVKGLLPSQEKSTD